MDPDKRKVLIKAEKNGRGQYCQEISLDGL